MALTEQQDTWVRARKNALASKSASSLLRRFQAIASLLESALIVVPVAAAALGFFLLTWEASPSNSTRAVVYQLGLLLVVCNALALFVHLAAEHLDFDGRATAHEHLAQGYSMIAQRLRAGDEMAVPMAKELFVVYKSSGIEPSDWHFQRADIALLRMKPYPLGLTDELILRCVRSDVAEKTQRA